jgi:hypothetical protein
LIKEQFPMMKFYRVYTVIIAITVLLSSAFAETTQPVRAKGDTLYAGDKEFRIWGFSTVHGLSLTDKQLQQSMDRLQFLGANMLRLHSMLQNRFPDWAGNPCGVVPPYGASTTSRKLVNLDQFWKFMDALRSRGMYYSINLVHNKVYLPGDADVIETSDEDKRAWQDAIKQWIAQNPARPTSMRHLCRFDERAAALEEERARQFLNLVDPKTNIRIADDPHFALIETVNEATGPRWIFEQKLATKMPPYFRNKLMRKWCAFLKERYGSQQAIRKAWTQKDRIGLAKSEKLATNTIGIHPVAGEFGDYADARRVDLLEFLVGLDMAFYRKMKKVYEEEGYKGLTGFGDISLCQGGNADYLWTQADLGDYWSDHDYPAARVDPLRWETLRCLKTCIRKGVEPHPYAWNRPYWKAEWRTNNLKRIVDPLVNAVYWSLTGIDGYTPHSWEMRYDKDWYGVVGLLANQVTQFDLNGDIPWQLIYRAAGRLFRSGEIKRIDDVEILKRFPQRANIVTDQVKRDHRKGRLLVETDHFAAVAVDHSGRFEFRDLVLNLTSDKLNVVIVERIEDKNLDYDYEITAVGLSGAFEGGAPMEWKPLSFVSGDVTFKDGAVVDSVTWVKEDGREFRTLPINDKRFTFRASSPLAPKGVRLYRVKMKQ